MTCVGATQVIVPVPLAIAEQAYLGSDRLSAVELAAGNLRCAPTHHVFHAVSALTPDR